MILGIGIDTIEIARVLRACERSSHFVERTFTTKEMAQFAEHKVRKASDFAAKEAVAKAFRTGFYQCEPREIEGAAGRTGGTVCAAVWKGKKDSKTTGNYSDTYQYYQYKERSYGVCRGDR